MALGKPPTKAAVKNSTPSPGVYEQVLAMPGLQGMAEPKIFRDYHEKLAPKLVIPPTSRAILKAFSNIDVTAEKLALILAVNPYYSQLLLRVIAALGKRTDIPSLEAGIVLLGMQNFRTLVMAIQMVRTQRQVHPGLDANGKLDIDAKQIMKFAIAAEENVTSSKGTYSDTAYMAGVLFDTLNLAAADLAEDKKKTPVFIESVFRHGMKSAVYGTELSKQIPDFGFAKYVYSACLIHDIGKVCMAILDPSYLAFCDMVDKKGVPHLIRLYAEQLKYGAHHALLGAMCCRSVGLFHVLEETILFHHEPFLIKSRHKKQFQLAALVTLSSNIANTPQTPTNPEDPVFATWKGPELKGFGLAPKDIIPAVAKASKMKMD